MSENKKPPLGARPAWMVAWQRIGELSEAIVREYETSQSNIKYVRKWAEEIRMQCDIIDKVET